MPSTRIKAANTTLCLIDTQTHALAARAMRLSLTAMDFADAVFISDSAADTGGARHVAIAPLVGRAAYSRFVMKELLRHVETEHVLLIQWDGYVVHPDAWRDDFLEHDYIGARWGFHKDAHCVGNGGFSLRSRRLLEALQDPAIDRYEPEDELICRHYRPLLESRYGTRFAPPEVADRFSFETTYPPGKTLGFHGLFNMWQFLSDEEVPGFVAAMPRSVLGSIQYLALAKNFIDLKRLDSARVLLEQRQRVFPADAKCAAMLQTLNGGSTGTHHAAPVSRNAPCPCGSGKRYKHCCGQEGVAQAVTSATAENTPETLLKQAMTDHQAGRLDAARKGYEAVVALGDDAIAEHYLGVLDMQDKRPLDGERRIRAALAKRGDVPDFYNNLGLCLRAQNRLEEAVAEYRKALDLHPAYAPAWSNLGLDLHKLGHLGEALDAFNRALVLDANLMQARFSRALVLLTQGEYAQGWAGYDYRMRCPEYAANYRLPAMAGMPRPWQGEALAGKALLLIAEQGIGDTLQFIRYARQLAEQGGKVDLHVRQGHVAGLLRNAQGVSEVYTGSAAIPAHDYYCHLLSLPRLCNTRSLGDVPADVPYLAAPADRRAYWRQRLDAIPARLRVGLAWAGSPSNVDDRNRSCSLQALTGLFEVPDVAWINLQIGVGREELQSVQTPILDWGNDQTDYAETAALMAELDLIITVDTSIAHAAGALARPVWVMLQYIADFRWLLDRNDSPWYPTARLFRQPRPRDWAGVVASLKGALADFMVERS
ncbi:MAG: tetratricopeptide repeat protein [Thiobacillus sp.]|nr:tetratricopeptide repeat protein [Thiobacillus sp.]